MANSLIVLPLRDDTAELMPWLAEQAVTTEGLPTGVLPTPELLVGILRDLDWPCAPSSSGGRWHANEQSRAGSWPPVQEVELGEDVLTFRLGPLFGPWEICRRAARTCGTLVAVETGGCATVVVTPATTFEEFHRALTGEEPDPREREWTAPPTPEQVRRRAPSDLMASAAADGVAATTEQSLEYALGGGVGCGSEAMTVGHAVQAYRWGGVPAAHPGALDAARYRAVAARLREHVRSADVPIPELVWALGQVEGAVADLQVLVARLDGRPEAAETVEMARVFLRA